MRRGSQSASRSARYFNCACVARFYFNCASAKNAIREQKWKTVVCTWAKEEIRLTQIAECAGLAHTVLQLPGNVEVAVVVHQGWTEGVIVYIVYTHNCTVVQYIIRYENIVSKESGIFFGWKEKYWFISTNIIIILYWSFKWRKLNLCFQSKRNITKASYFRFSCVQRP